MKRYSADREIHEQAFPGYMKILIFGLLLSAFADPPVPAEPKANGS